MARDFASKRSPEPERSRVPRWVWVFTAIASVAFVGFLYYLSQVPGEGGGADAVRQQLQGSMPEADQQADPEAATEGGPQAPSLEEAFEFYQLLKDDEVRVPAPDRPAPDEDDAGEPTPDESGDDRRWLIQVASFGERADADRLRAELIINGLTNAHLAEADLGERGIYHRVLVGPFEDRSRLNQAQDILVSLNHQVIVRTLD